MGEIINLNIGKAGVKIGQKFLSSIAKQHFQDSQNPRGRPNTFFYETIQKKQQSRSLFIDIHSNSVDKINLNTQNYLIPEQNIFKGSGIDTDHFTVGKSRQGSHIIDQAFERVQRQVQKCDSLSGFLIINSLGGGTGAGLMSNMLGRIRQYYCDRIAQQHAILPEVNKICSPLHVYNSMFALHHLIEQSDITFFAQNSAFDERLLTERKIMPTIDDLNQVHAQNLTELTAPYRFSGSLNTSQRKICVNMIMYPRMKFMVSAFSNKDQKLFYLQNCLLDKNFSKTNFFDSHPLKYGIFNVHVNCRDNFAYESEIDSKVRSWVQRKKLQFTQWMPNNIHMSITQPAFSGERSASAIINSRHVKNIFKQLCSKFSPLFKRGAFVQKYYQQGIDKMQFVQVQSNIQDMIAEYGQYDDYDFEEQYFEMMPEDDQQY